MKFIPILILLTTTAQGSIILNRDGLRSVISDDGNINNITFRNWNINVVESENGFEIITNKPTTEIFNKGNCKGSVKRTTDYWAEWDYICTGIHSHQTIEVGMNISISAGGYLQRSLSVIPIKNSITVIAATLLNITILHESLTSVTKANPFSQRQVAMFLRSQSQLTNGLAISIKSPFGYYDMRQTLNNSQVTAMYEGHLNSTGNRLLLDDVLIIPTSVVVGSPIDVSYTELQSFKDCVSSFMLPTRGETLKLNVGWDESDYQIDASTQRGRDQYKRIISRAANFSLTHVVYAPRNTHFSSRYNTTDGWGWEDCLWFSLGELVRENKFSPGIDPIPSEIQEILNYAKENGIKLMSYVYPALGFKELEDYFVPATGYAGQVLNLGSPHVQERMIDLLDKFLIATDVGGFAWDHSITAGPQHLFYSQWRGWMRIIETLKTRHPEIAMDHRVDARKWGPWHVLAGSYSEPISSDEDPETYGVLIPSLHTDMVAASNMRLVNYLYSTECLIPMITMPGFITHLSERRADNGSYPCFKNTAACFDVNTRDFDLLGYRYSLLSSIATASHNNLFNMIPARDDSENNLFPDNDVLFIRKWLRFTDQYKKTLQNTNVLNIPYLNIGIPRQGSIDGTFAIHDQQGFVFIINPNPYKLSVQLPVNNYIGLNKPSSSSYRWNCSIIYPLEYMLPPCAYNDTVLVEIMGESVVVVQFSSSHFEEFPPTVFGIPFRNQSLSVYGYSGEVYSMYVRSDHFNGLINGITCTTNTIETHHGMEYQKLLIKMKGDILSDTTTTTSEITGKWNGTIVVTNDMRNQLESRKKSYPIPWNPTDYKATWLVPSRLLLYIYFENPDPTLSVSLTLNSIPTNLSMAWNSRGALPHTRNCFLGWYLDASFLINSSDVNTVSVSYSEQAVFKGVYWQNIIPETTDDVATC